MDFARAFATNTVALRNDEYGGEFLIAQKGVYQECSSERKAA